MPTESSSNLKVCVLNFSISLISPTRIAGEKNIKRILNLEKTPDVINPLLRQPVFPPTILHPLQKLQKRARTALLKLGSRSPVLGWVTSEDLGLAAYGELDEIRKEFLIEKAELLNGYEDACDDHLKELSYKCAGFNNAQLFLDSVKEAQPTLEYLSEQIDFKLIHPLVVEIDQDAEKVMIRDDIFAQAIKDVAIKAVKCQESIYTTTKVHFAREAQMKFDGMVPLNPKFKPIADELQAVLSQIEIKANDAYSALEQASIAGVVKALTSSYIIMTKIDKGEGLFMTPLQIQAIQETTPDDSLLEALFDDNASTGSDKSVDDDSESGLIGFQQDNQEDNYIEPETETKEDDLFDPFGRDFSDHPAQTPEGYTTDPEEETDENDDDYLSLHTSNNSDYEEDDVLTGLDFQEEDHSGLLDSVPREELDGEPFKPTSQKTVW